MLFILQKEKNNLDLDIDLMVLRQELNRQKFQHEYLFMTLEELNPNIKGYSIKNIENAISVGTIEFVSAFLKKFHNIDNMNPIEVPNELRLDKFLQRKYSIIEGKDLPTDGNYFVKNVSKLKSFSYSGNMEYLMYDGIFDKPIEGVLDTSLHLNKNDLFQLSEIKHILAEYRVFVVQDKIEGIQFYDGNPCIMPTPKEIDTIKEMISRYMLNLSRPMAYSLDIAIIKNNGDRTIMVLECHPFTSLGLYGLSGSFLPYAYMMGFDWYVKYNIPVEKFSN